MGSYKQAAGRAVLAGALALGGSLVLGDAKPAAAEGRVPITACPALITTSGNFVLVNDLTCPATSTVAINVQANNVHLVLGAHTITGAGPDNGVLGIVAAGVTGLSITGGTITDFNVGILIESSGGARVSGTTLLRDSQGITLADCAGCQITSSQVSGSVLAGIAVIGSSSGTRIAGNTVTGSDTGIMVVQGAAGVRVTGNTATGNNLDLKDDNAPPPCANTWRGNTFDTVSGDGAACIR